MPEVVMKQYILSPGFFDDCAPEGWNFKGFDFRIKYYRKNSNLFRQFLAALLISDY